MANPKDILVTTTSSLDGLVVKQYLKPISAHIVAGTNLFSDFFASFSDVFGGRSQTYQKQISSLYNEAIERLRISAYEIGANCIIGLNVDMDEISGKGKSMFMLTAIGTAVIVDGTITKRTPLGISQQLENIDIERLKSLQRKREIIEKATDGTLVLDDEVWDFITANEVHEVYEFVLGQLRKYIGNVETGETFNKYYGKTLEFLNGLPEEIKLKLLYESIIVEENEQLASKLCKMVEDLTALDFNYVNQVFNASEFSKQKRGLKILTADKPFYNNQDIAQLNLLVDFIKSKFPERGVRSMKKQLLSSKEKEIWTCECKGTAEIGKLCSVCNKDIYGFKASEVNPPKAVSLLDEKISLITECLQ